MNDQTRTPSASEHAAHHETTRLQFDRAQFRLSKDHYLGRLPLPAALIGLVILGISVVVSSGNSERFFYSYLLAYLYYISIGLGALFFVLIQYVTRAGWSVVVRRAAENLSGPIILFALLFIPVGWGAPQIFEWAHHDAVAHDPLLQEKSSYLNLPFFYVRGILYLACWAAIAWWFRKQSLKQDETEEPMITRRLQTFSAPAIVLTGVTLTFAAFDWMMSLDPHWYSTIFGVYFFAGCFLAGLAATTLVVAFPYRPEPVADVITPEHFHDLGKLIFAFVVFWAYIGFSQFMLIWYANIPEETAWYTHRLEDGWQAVTLFLVLGHFVLPFFALLSREIKRKRRSLAIACFWLLAMHYLDLYWLVIPSYGPPGGNFLLDLGTLLGLGCLFVAAFAYLSYRGALIPVRDPRLSESLAFENM